MNCIVFPNRRRNSRDSAHSGRTNLIVTARPSCRSSAWTTTVLAPADTTCVMTYRSAITRPTRPRRVPEGLVGSSVVIVERTGLGVRPVHKITVEGLVDGGNDGPARRHDGDRGPRTRRRAARGGHRTGDARRGDGGHRAAGGR